MLGVSRSAYYAWRRRPPSERTLLVDAVLLEKIETIHTNSQATYGAPRVHAELRALGIRCGRPQEGCKAHAPSEAKGFSLRGRRMRTTYRIALQQRFSKLLRIWLAGTSLRESRIGCGLRT